MPRFKPIRFVLWGLPFNVGISFFAASVGYAAWIATAGFPLWTAMVFIIMLFISVTVHELGHAFALKAFGARHSCMSVNVHALGGHVTFCGECHERLSMPKRFAVFVAGPAAGFGLAAVAAVLCVFAKTDVMFLLVSQLVLVNVLMNVSNLFPTYPLDGGQAMEATLRGLTGRRPVGEYAAIALSGACLAALIAAAWWWGQDQSPIGKLMLAGNLLMLVMGNLARAIGPTD